jgi:hypothetical protein
MAARRKRRSPGFLSPRGEGWFRILPRLGFPMEAPTTDSPLDPSPDQYGLTAERLAIFERQPTRLGEDHPVINYLLALGAFVCASALAAKTESVLYFLPFLIACGVAAWLVSAGIKRIFRFSEYLLDFFDLAKKKRHPDYKKFVVFSAARREHLARVVEELSLRREELKEQRRIQREELLRHRSEARAQERWWKSLSGHQFERELSELFKLRGYDVRLTGFLGADGGVDMVIKSGSSKTIIVQCKAHRHSLAPDP